MTGLQHVYLAYGVTFVLLMGYAIMLSVSLFRARRIVRRARQRST